MESQQTPEILDYRNENGHGWSFYKHDGVLLHIHTTPEAHMEIIRNVQKFELRDDDVMIVAYPKCGTHWLWEIVTMLRAGNSEYNKKAKEIAMLGMPKFERADELPSPRVLNSHLYFRHLPEKLVEKRIKTILIMRNPKDVSVSHYHHVSGLQKVFMYDGTYSEFLDLFLEGKVPGGGYADYVKDWQQVKQDNPDLPFLTLFYENLKEDPVKNIKTVAEFIGESVTDELCQQIAEACSFKKLKVAATEVKEELPNSNRSEVWKEGHEGVYRKGEVGDWKNWITVAKNERFDDVIDRKFEGTGIVFTYE
ncbi:sulfotransferase 1C2-like isoform X2 [Haliotis rufescens]|uniref:sulfotransferase 1C2-like isoform X1 n=1 Tax=Haliotis rufescens TaxID=6454 RepID=UPI00201FA7C1|nr:sulfotransferase 1C2-like isoform X1 [Haliotis rufescens]XP_048257028.1 sulfotransferase 1C2-like isoform X2 [Haliotis rufescens]